ncbi:MAG: ATP-binding protein [Thermodesulfobacteriota bacterium]|nr:ATP-binding protein [Thermodesulfobacteriota bacterium]
MNEKAVNEDFDSVFSDLLNGCEDLHTFLQDLQKLVPDAVFRLYSNDGCVVPEDDHLGLESETYDSLIKDVAEDGSVLSFFELPDKSLLYCRAVPQINSVLFFKFPGCSAGLFPNQVTLSLLQSFIEHALLKKETRVVKLENEQLIRQSEVRNEQFRKLLADNHQQYLLIQSKEKEYAKTLEIEIDRQTSELREKNRQLEEASRLKSEFLANMSHELRTPMNAVIGFSDILAETDLNEIQSEYCKTISKSAAGLLVLINDVLDLAKIESGKFELENDSFSIAELIKNVDDMFKMAAKGKDLCLSHFVDSRLPGVLKGDANRIRQIMVNLTGNAMKFTNQGCVDIRADLTKQTEDAVDVRFSVSDTGIGIPEERQDAVFEKFTQADGSTTRKFGGTGLGLAISNELVKLMKGKMTLTSVTGKGSAFSFTIPMTKSAQEQTEKTTKDPAESHVDMEGDRKIRVLLVEDNKVNQRLTGIFVQKQGHEVGVAGDGMVALEKLKTGKWDLILMDIQMPNMDGREATIKIREIESSPEMRDQYESLYHRKTPVPIVGLTAHARKEDEEGCYSVGMDAFLTKPIKNQRLAEIIQDQIRRIRALEKESPLVKPEE